MDGLDTKQEKVLFKRSGFTHTDTHTHTLAADEQRQRNNDLSIGCSFVLLQLESIGVLIFKMSPPSIYAPPTLSTAQ